MTQVQAKVQAKVQTDSFNIKASTNSPVSSDNLIFNARLKNASTISDINSQNSSDYVSLDNIDEITKYTPNLMHLAKDQNFKFETFYTTWVFFAVNCIPFLGFIAAGLYLSTRGAFNNQVPFLEAVSHNMQKLPIYDKFVNAQSHIDNLSISLDNIHDSLNDALAENIEMLRFNNNGTPEENKKAIDIIKEKFCDAEKLNKGQISIRRNLYLKLLSKLADDGLKTKKVIEDQVKAFTNEVLGETQTSDLEDNVSNIIIETLSNTIIREKQLFPDTSQNSNESNDFINVARNLKKDLNQYFEKVSWLFNHPHEGNWFNLSRLAWMVKNTRIDFNSLIITEHGLDKNFAKREGIDARIKQAIDNESFADNTFFGQFKRVGSPIFNPDQKVEDYKNDFKKLGFDEEEATRNAKIKVGKEIKRQKVGLTKIYDQLHNYKNGSENPFKSNTEGKNFILKTLIRLQKLLS